MTGPAFFRLGQDGEVLLPEPISGSGWDGGQLRGMAVSGALARATEQVVSSLRMENLRPARFTLDLYKPALQVPTIISTNVVRQGRRLCLVDAAFVQGGKPVARSVTLYLKAGETPSGAVWSPGRHPVPPPHHLRPEAEDLRLYYGEEAGWSPTPSAQHSADRKQSWHFAMPIVEGEPLTPFQMAASIADVSNVVSNWGSGGLQFINADVTLALARLPTELEFGLSAVDRVEADGLSVGTAVMFDRAGVFGTTTVLGLANALRSVDPRTRARLVGHEAAPIA
ncbi:acyl-CoA thioesterase domain-containing protein [Arthrobacter sp. NPDC093128]|uniref:acyl-CoA thioesterase domain-containing protein n=1 Tax=Arthrobacter sp. NPDC093128 TaxID=3154979 RepID=UPI00341F539D